MGGGGIKNIEVTWRRHRVAGELDEQVQPDPIRHTGARWLRSQGVPMDEIAGQLGHRRHEGVTGIYAPFGPDYLASACRGLNDLLVRSFEFLLSGVVGATGIEPVTPTMST